MDLMILRNTIFFIFSFCLLSCALAPLSRTQTTVEVQNLFVSISGAPFKSTVASGVHSLHGPILKNKDVVSIFVEPTHQDLGPFTYSYYCPQLDVFQESSTEKFEFAVSDSLLKQAGVDVYVAINTSLRDAQGQPQLSKALKVQFPIRSP